MPQSILFDLDGTLLDTAPDIGYVFNQVCEEEGVAPLSLSVLRPAVSIGSEALLSLAFGNGLNPNDRDRLKKRFFELYQAHDCSHTVFFPHIPELLEHLTREDIRWGIVTNRMTYLTQKILAQHTILNQTQCVVSADTTAHAKPHPAPLLHACEILGANPKRSVYIGDAKTDIQAGRGAGMATMLVLFGYADPLEAKTWQADHTVLAPEHLRQSLAPWLNSA